MLTAVEVCVKVKAHTSVRAMSEDQLKAFLEAVKADAGLQEQFKAAADTDALVEIAKAAGFIISAEEIKKAQVKFSEEELEGVSGGQAGLSAFFPNVVIVAGNP